MKLTPKQERAVCSENKDILVSAAAGSGKTSVLAERAARLVIKGADIRRMLICTFTNAAAQEMRQRIISKLLDIAEDKNDQAIRSQAEYAAFADICTIHSFAQKIIRENYIMMKGGDAVPGQRILGAEEMELIKRTAAENCFESLYEEEDPDFLMLRAKYAGRRDTDLMELLLGLYDYVNSLPERLGWLERHIREPFDYGPVISAEKERCLERAVRLLTECIRISDENQWIKQAENDRADLDKLSEIRETSSDIRSFRLTRLSTGLAPEEEKERLRALREEIKEAAGEAAGLDISADSLKRDQEYVRGETKAFLSVLKRFDAEYLRLKRIRKSMDFDDLMHYANMILSDRTVADSYRDRYDYVFVDEYQDTNPVQEEIIGRIARPSGRFMVGDIKQSIYRFRLADPMIFSEKARKFRQAGDGSAPYELIMMNDNFRSAPKLVNALNHVMGNLMSPELGEIEYDDGEKLIANREAEGVMELMLTGDELTGTEKIRAEFMNIADRIKELKGTEVDGKALSFRDFCVLVRDGRETVRPVMAEVFESSGIPIKSEPGRAATSGMLLFTDLLKLTDGFYSDTALIAVMRSYIGGFGEAELAQIRAMDMTGTFTEAFLKYAKGQDALAEKCAGMLDRILMWRLYEKALSMEDFLIYLKTGTDFPASLEAMPDGENAAVSFDLFFEALRDMAKNVRSVSELAGKLEEIYADTGMLPMGDRGGRDEDAVSFMTVHGSKGLQFPVVILACTDKRFNDDDMKKKVLWHNGMGLAMDIIDEKAHVTSPTAIKALMHRVKKAEDRSEELRILYVAMTRAENRLIISGTVRPGEPGKLILPLRDPYSLIRCSSMLEWIVNGLSDVIGGTSADGTEIETGIRPAGQSAEIREKKLDSLEALFSRAVKQEAPGFISYDWIDVPSWVGVSWLLPEYTHEEGDYRSGERREMTGASLGTLIHLFFENAPLDLAGREAVEDHIRSMRSKEIITAEEEKELIRCSGYIGSFYGSGLMERVRRSGHVFRELPFSLLVSAEELGYPAGGDDIIVNGVIDLMFEEDGGYVIIDYKSNHMTEDQVEAMADHYRKQIRMYSYAAEKIMGRPVKESYLFFLRPGIGYRIG